MVTVAQVQALSWMSQWEIYQVSCMDDTSLKKQKLYKFGSKICMNLSFDLAVDSLFSKLNKPEEEL